MLRYSIAAALFGAVIFIATQTPAAAFDRAGNPSIERIAPATEFSARKKKVRKIKSVKRERHVRAARVAESSGEFCGDRYCGSGGASHRAPVRGIARAGKTVMKATMRGGVGLVARAEAHLGATASQLGLPRSQWCSDFMNKITGGGTGSRLARSWAHAGSPAPRGCVGCVAVLARGRSATAGHVGVVKGWQGGNPVIVSGNHARRVGVGVYPAGRLVALRWVGS